jgi:hypothetical protein
MRIAPRFLITLADARLAALHVTSARGTPMAASF